MLTLPQASKQTGKHEDTIRRLIKNLLKADQKAKEKIIQEQTPRGFHYLIDEEYLLQHLQSFQMKKPKNSVNDKTALNQPLRQPLNNVAHQPMKSTNQPTYAEVKAKDETIAILKKQLEEKDEQIKTLLERGRETNVLLKGYQDRYLLEAPMQIPNAPSAGNQQAKSDQRKPTKPTKQTAKQNQQQKKKGFFSWLK
jgi:hypothetical protein